MAKDIGNRPANRHCSCKFAKMSGVLVTVNGAIFVTKNFEPQMDCTYS